MNMFALIQLQKKIAERIAELSGKNVILGRYVHQADSYHIYGSYMEEFENRFLRMHKERSFEDRTYRYQDMKGVMEEAIPGILEKVAKMSETQDISKGK
jgi:thymidylate synthase